MTKVKAVYQEQVLKNKLSDGSIVIVRVMALNVAGTEMPRVCDAREILPDAMLISKNLTWAAPLENLYEDSETKALTEKAFTLIGHADSLAQWRF